MTSFADLLSSRQQMLGMSSLLGGGSLPQKSQAPKKIKSPAKKGGKLKGKVPASLFDIPEPGDNLMDEPTAPVVTPSQNVLGGDVREEELRRRRQRLGVLSLLGAGNTGGWVR